MHCSARRVRLSLVMLCEVAVSLVPFSHAGADFSALTARFIDVGQGDSCWLHLHNGDDVLIDGGKPQAGPTVVAYLSSHVATDIELTVATHGDADHIGGLA